MGSRWGRGQMGSGRSLRLAGRFDSQAGHRRLVTRSHDSEATSDDEAMAHGEGG